ncbi:MAG: SUMF1/EgtB/PvdO family nonheme iron enzyme [Caldilineaceae bacterium]|nr:SUMF1/EgtB/PvdO family nonheme iron enzyme [Caldilineaceae bacterium]
MDSSHPTSSPNTGGGAHVGRDVETHIFIGRDSVTNLTVNLTGAELEETVARLLALLSAQGARVRAGEVHAGDQRLDVNGALVDAVRQYQQAAPGGDQQARIRQYLAYLCIDPDFHGWQQRYVSLSGGYRAVPELTHSYSAILVRGEGPQRKIERVPLDDIRDALDEHAAFVLLAQPGGGKTTVLQRTALDRALACLRGPDIGRGENEKESDLDGLIPLFVRLSAQEVRERPLAFLARMWREAVPGSGDQSRAEEEVKALLREKRLCILCDALNESRRENYADRMLDWRAFAAELPGGNRLIFSCRKLDYGGELGVQQVEIDDLDKEQIREFACRYLDGEPDGPQGAAFWQALAREHGDLLELAGTPYYLQMLVEVYAADAALPPHRAQLFEAFVTQLFGREQGKRHAVPWIDPAAQHLALSDLAYAMQELGAGTQVKAAWARECLPQAVTLPDGATVPTPPGDLLALARSTSFLGNQGDGTVKFTHHLMQEYFAAEALLRRLVAGEDLRALWRVPARADEMPTAERGEWDPLPPPPTRGWEETTILAAGLYPDLYAAIEPVNPALAARCLLESGAETREEEERKRVKQSQARLLERMVDVAIHVRSRVEAGLLLGRLGDPRFVRQRAGDVEFILPPMIEIPGGDAMIGSDADDDLADDDEKPRHAVSPAAYAIGRYPVTNAEYGCFVNAGGYQDERYWTTGGRYWLRGEKVPGEEDPADWWIRAWKRFKQDPTELDRRVASGAMTEREADNPWRILIGWSEERVIAQVREWYPENVAVHEPRFWRDSAYNNPSQPVTGLCWYEAMAYAAWLAEISGEDYWLPAEAEWEWAARGGGRIFPWGNNWDPERCNSLEGENRVMGSTPVGSYPHGATPDGIHDLAGNIWEWTASRYAAYPYDPAANLEDPDGPGLRICRGGGWAANRKMVRCAYRNWNDPRNWNSSAGFRLARSSL